MTDQSKQMKRTIITLYGYGFVGKALFNFFKDHYDLIVVDPHLNEPAKTLITGAGHLNFESYKAMRSTGIDPSDYAVIAVPTEPRDDGSCDTSIVESILRESQHGSYLVKSTVTPGTTERLVFETGKRIAMSPEWIGEGNYEIKWWKGQPHPTNMRLHDFHIFGGAREVTKEWVDIYLPIAGPSVTYAQTTALTAEITKYTENIWGAMKVTWANEMYEICERLGVDWREVRELWALDGRVEKMHTAVFPMKRGWSGKCYPKDLMALIKRMQREGYEPELLKEVVRTNARFSSDPQMQKLPELL